MKVTSSFQPGSLPPPLSLSTRLKTGTWTLSMFANPQLQVDCENEDAPLPSPWHLGICLPYDYKYSLARQRKNIPDKRLAIQFIVIGYVRNTSICSLKTIRKHFVILHMFSIRELSLLFSCIDKLQQELFN